MAITYNFKSEVLPANDEVLTATPPQALTVKDALVKANPSLQGDQRFSSLVNSAWACLNDILGTDDDVIGLVDTPQPVVNCLNGELWISASGEVDLRPHRAASNLTYCLPIVYDPKAKCPMFDMAVLDIFSKAEQPEDRLRPSSAPS
jgi:hypothetical protein